MNPARKMMRGEVIRWDTVAAGGMVRASVRGLVLEGYWLILSTGLAKN